MFNENAPFYDLLSIHIFNKPQKINMPRHKVTNHISELQKK